MTERVIEAEGATMKPSVSVATALALVLSPSAMAQGVKRDILGLSLGLPLPEIAKPDVIASAGAWKSPEQAVQVGDYRCKRLDAPWKGPVGQVVCRVDQQGQLYLDVALRPEPPVVQSITYLFCSTEEPARLSERVYQAYGIANGLTALNAVIWGPVYKLDSRTTLTFGYGGHACLAGRGYEMRLQDFQLLAQNLKGVPDRARQTASKRKP